MNLAYTMQKFQDWFTQQWVILWGRKINPTEYLWLIGPFGELNGIGEDFIHQLAKKENLIILRNTKSKGLISSISRLVLPQEELSKLSQKVIDFYEKTADYKVQFQVKWNPIFKPFAYLVNRFFSQRINQLNIPIENIREPENLSSEIIELITAENKEVKYTIWLRKFESSGNIIYSGIYTTCQLPSGVTCIKAIFPLPKGSATVILKPSVGENHELVLDSSGKKFGDAGFYFLVKDSESKFWSQYHKNFTDKLIVSEDQGNLKAIQTLKFWNLEVANFEYFMLK